MHFTIRRWALMMIVAFYCVGPVAQETTRRLTGEIRDLKGSVVANALIEVLKRDGTVEVSTYSDVSGHYSIVVELNGGPYRMRVSAPGFAAAITDIPLQWGVADMGYTLQPATPTEASKVTKPDPTPVATPTPRTTFVSTSTEASRTAEPKFVVDDRIADELRTASTLTVNGKSTSFRLGVNDDVVFLGDQQPTDGLNLLQTAKRKVLVWAENRKLSVFERPYEKSYAVLVAIDDYKRLKDPKHRGPTGFGQLGKMVEYAEALKKSLLELGFPRENIVPLYDENADSTAINDVLQSFWAGGRRSSADRVFFYFGGHGSARGNVGFLVTYDYDVTRPTTTSLLMRDLTGRHSENIEARHLLVALDACSSGLALPLGGERTDKALLKRFRALSILRADTAPRARNILLAGTEDQEAVYDNGGIFTQALVGGLSGEADYNKDGIIEFQELSNYVKDEVAFAASQLGHEQTVGSYKLRSAGATGEVVFLKENW